MGKTLSVVVVLFLLVAPAVAQAQSEWACAARIVQPWGACTGCATCSWAASGWCSCEVLGGGCNGVGGCEEFIFYGVGCPYNWCWPATAPPTTARSTRGYPTVCQVLVPPVLERGATSLPEAKRRSGPTRKLTRRL